MKKRMGYNIIELLVVITAISLITAIGYKGVNILFDNIKTEGLKTEISKVKTALAKSQAAGNVYWGGDFTGVSRTELTAINPLPNADATTCNYRVLISDSLDDTYCGRDNVINAEHELYKKMLEMEFKFADGTFRSGRFPTSSIGFLPNFNGYSGILFSDVPGNIARRVYEDLNTPKWQPLKDGLTSNRPIMIFKANSSTVNFEYTTTDGLSKLLEEVVPATDVDPLKTIGGIPKVTLIYMYTHRKETW